MGPTAAAGLAPCTPRHPRHPCAHRHAADGVHALRPQLVGLVAAHGVAAAVVFFIFWGGEHGRCAGDERRELAGGGCAAIPAAAAASHHAQRVGGDLGYPPPQKTHTCIPPTPPTPPPHLLHKARQVLERASGCEGAGHSKEHDLGEGWGERGVRVRLLLLCGHRPHVDLPCLSCCPHGTPLPPPGAALPSCPWSGCPLTPPACCPPHQSN